MVKLYYTILLCFKNTKGLLFLYLLEDVCVCVCTRPCVCICKILPKHEAQAQDV